MPGIRRANPNTVTQVEHSCRKFQRRDKVTNNIKIEVDESLVSTVIEALIVEGWRAPSRRRPYLKSYKSGMPRNSPSRAFYKGKKNPLRAHGKPLKCFDCDSEYPMKNKCDKEKGKPKDKKKEKDKKKDRSDVKCLTSPPIKHKAKEVAMFLDIVEKDNEAKENVEQVLAIEKELCLLVEEAAGEV